MSEEEDVDMERVKSASEIIEALDDKLDELDEPISIYRFGAFALDQVNLDESNALAEINMSIDTAKFKDEKGQVEAIGKLKIKEGDKVLFKASHDKRVTAFVARDDDFKTIEARGN